MSHMYNIVDKSKIRKQINYVEEVEVYNKLNSLLDDVLKVDNTNFNEKYNWCRIMMMLRDIKNNPTDRSVSLWVRGVIKRFLRIVMRSRS